MKKKRRKSGVQFGEQGVRAVRWLGDEGRDFRGQVTGTLYAFSPRHPVRPVDVRDLPGLARDGGRENFEDITPRAEPCEEDERPRAKRARAVEPELDLGAAPEPAPVEVTHAEELADVG